MIRWRFIAVRLVIVLLSLMLVRMAAAPLAEWMIVRSLEKATGAKVAIHQTNIGLFPPKVSLEGISLADPRKEMRNLFEAEAMVLHIDGEALLKRRFEIADGRIDGIKIGGDRTESGALEVVPEPAKPDSGPSAVSRLIQKFADQTQEQVEEFGESLETYRASRQIRDRWLSQYDSLRGRAKQLEDNIRLLRDNAKAIDNPLRDLPRLQQTLRQAETIKAELVSIRKHLDALPGQMRSDFSDLQQARNADAQRIASYLPVDLQGEEVQLGPELLGMLVREQLREIKQYAESGRKIADVTVTAPTADRIRGETVLLGARQYPSWLIRQCEISGEMSVNSDRYDMIGTLENVTTETSKQEGPLHARLRLEGPRVVRIDYKRHYAEGPQTSTPPVERLKIHWPKLPLPAQKVGNADDLAIVIDGGDLELWVDLVLEGSHIEGRLVSQQTQTRLALQTSPKLGKNVAIRSLSNSLAGVNEVAVEARFAGTWRSMDLDIATSLQDELSQGIQQAVAASLESGRQRLNAKLDEVYREQMRELESFLANQQREARDVLAQADKVVESMSQKVVGELGAAEAYLGKLRGRADRIFK